VSDGQFDMNALLEQAMAMQQNIAAAQERAAAQVVEGHAAGGAVRVVMTGAGDVQRVHLSPDVVDPTDVALLEDLLAAAFRNAQAQVADLQSAAMGPLAGGFGGLLGS
jgi:DNA-binding YbaB/EbfC family protein